MEIELEEEERGAYIDFCRWLEGSRVCIIT